MTTPKPPPRTLQPAEERKIQLFLERAAPIVLEDPQLTAERWQFLAALANDLDLTADQFRSTIDDLLNRGVITGLDVTPPKPPPLPGRRGATMAAPLEDGVTEDFALTSPGAPPPVQKSPNLPKPEPARKSPAADNHSDAATSKVAGDGPRVVASDRLAVRREQFLDRAGAILAEQRGLNAKSQALLAAAAQDIGLSEAEAHAALEALYQPAEAQPAGANATTANEKLNAIRWRVEGAPVPIPPPPPKSPPETYLDFARPSLAAVRDGVVSQELEQRLIAHGTRVLGLSLVYARHLLLDLIAERKLRLASGADAPPPAPVPTPAAPADPRLAEFLQAAKSVMAQHRGLNAQSRVLISALARERGLTEQEVDQAIGSLTQRGPEEQIDRAQQERLAPFRSHVESVLKKPSRGILTPALNDKLVTAGIELFGLDGALASATIREITDKLQLPVITHEQAERHLTDLLQDVLSDGTSLTSAQRDRIELEGAQWGLPAIRVTNLIDDHLRQNVRQERAEQHMTRWALSGAVLALALVVVFFIWTAIVRSGRDGTSAPVTPVAPGPVSEPMPEKEPSWLAAHSDLAISVINARRDFPLLRKSLSDLDSNDTAHRNSAYNALVEYFFLQAYDEIRRKDLSEMLSHCLAVEPTEDSAGRLLNALLREVPEQSDKVALDAAAFPRMFWGVRTVAAALAKAKGQAQRVAQIVAALHRAVGVTPDPSQPATELEQLCLRSLAERLFRSLITAASGPLTNAAPLHSALVMEAAKYLDAARLDKFNAEFVTATLTTEPRRWQSYEDLIRQTSASRDPLAVLKLVELYEATSDSELRDFLGQVLLMRTSGTPPGRSVEEIAAFVRQGLGISDAHDPDGVWTKLSRDARGVLANATAPPEPTTPLLAEVLQLAHYSTLACAFAQNEWSNAAIVEWRKAGPPAPDAGLASKPEEVADGPRPAPTATIDRPTMEALRVAVAGLTARRSQPTDRLLALDSLARMVDQVPDLPPELAASVALHLLGNKSNAEHARVLERLPSLAKWNQLLVALADRVEDGSLTDEQLNALMNALLATERRLVAGKEGRVAARRELWQFVMRRLGTAEAPAKKSASVPDNAASLLANAYATQARLLGVTLSEAVVKLRDPLTTLRAMVDEYLSRLTAAKLSDAQRADLARIPHELTAMEFVAGTNDVQRLVSLERIWLRLLAVEAARRNEARATEARELVTSLQQKDRQAKHILSQLRDGQASLLQMWLLTGKRG